MVETIGLLLLSVGGTFVWIYENFRYVEIDKEDRRFWLKALALLSVIFGIFLWFILLFWAPK